MPFTPVNEYKVARHVVVTVELSLSLIIRSVARSHPHPPLASNAPSSQLCLPIQRHPATTTRLPIGDGFRRRAAGAGVAGAGRRQGELLRHLGHAALRRQRLALHATRSWHHDTIRLSIRTADRASWLECHRRVTRWYHVRSACERHRRQSAAAPRVPPRSSCHHR